jgi:hypothetical protein
MVPTDKEGFVFPFFLKLYSRNSSGANGMTFLTVAPP